MRLLKLSFAVPLLLALGCGSSGPELASVTGVVTFQNKPIEGGSLEFIPEGGGRPSMGITDSEGKFQMLYLHGVPGATLGKHKVRFQMGATDGPVPEEDQFKPPGAKKDIPQNLTLTPDLVEVSKGANEMSFELTSQS